MGEAPNTCVMWGGVIDKVVQAVWCCLFAPSPRHVTKLAQLGIWRPVVGSVPECGCTRSWNLLSWPRAFASKMGDCPSEPCEWPDRLHRPPRLILPREAAAQHEGHWSCLRRWCPEDLLSTAIGDRGLQ